MSSIDWLSHDEFIMDFEQQTDRVRVKDLFNCRLSFEEARALIPTIPMEIPPGYEDLPGKVSEWYGRAGNLFFVVLCHTQAPIQNLDVSIQPSKKKSYLYPWQEIENLSELPAAFHETIQLVYFGNETFPYALEARYAGDLWHIYQGSSKEECSELLKQLKAYGSRFQLEVKELSVA